MAVTATAMRLPSGQANAAMSLPAVSAGNFFGQPNGFVKPPGPPSGAVNQLAIRGDKTDPMSTDRPPISRQGRFICGLLAAGMGALLLLVALGVVPAKPSSADGPMWIVTAAGMMFLLAGVSIAVGAIQGVPATGELPKDTGWWLRLFYYVLGLVIVGALASIGSWVTFGPGVQAFGGPGMFLLSREANDMLGRIVFGFGTALTWLFWIALAVSGARKLFRRGQA